MHPRYLLTLLAGVVAATPVIVVDVDDEFLDPTSIALMRADVAELDAAGVDKDFERASSALDGVIHKIVRWPGDWHCKGGCEKNCNFLMIFTPIGGGFCHIKCPRLPHCKHGHYDRPRNE